MTFLNEIVYYLLEKGICLHDLKQSCAVGENFSKNK